MPRQFVIIYCTDPTECYEDLKLFCERKGLKYNTWARKDFSKKHYHKGFLVRREPLNFFMGHKYLDEKLEIIRREK